MPLVALETTGAGRRVLAIGAEARRSAGAQVLVVNPFSHARVIVGDIEVADAVFRFAVMSVTKRSVLRRPDVIMHPLRSTADGLADIERRALVELAAAAGGSRVGVHQGAVLDAEQLQAFPVEPAKVD